MLSSNAHGAVVQTEDLTRMTSNITIGSSRCVKKVNNRLTSCQSLKGTFSLNPSHHRPHLFYRTYFTDTAGLLNGFLFSFYISLTF